MRNKHATSLVVMIHCLTTNSNYDVRDLSLSYMKSVAEDYRAFIKHREKYPENVPEIVSSKEEALGKIRVRLLQLGLIGGEVNEYA